MDPTVYKCLTKARQHIRIMATNDTEPSVNNSEVLCRIDKAIKKAKDLRDDMYERDAKKGVRCTQNGRIAGLQDAREIVEDLAA